MNHPTGLQPKEINLISLSWKFILPHFVYNKERTWTANYFYEPRNSQNYYEKNCLTTTRENWGLKLKYRSLLTWGMPDSSCSMICVLRAILALKGVGSARASSNELVCKDWVPPNTAAMASIVVRTILLYGSWSENSTRWDVTSLFRSRY